jgi:hypothetical protein
MYIEINVEYYFCKLCILITLRNMIKALLFFLSESLQCQIAQCELFSVESGFTYHRPNRSFQSYKLSQLVTSYVVPVKIIRIVQFGIVGFGDLLIAQANYQVITTTTTLVEMISLKKCACGVKE